MTKTRMTTVHHIAVILSFLISLTFANFSNAVDINVSVKRCRSFTGETIFDANTTSDPGGPFEGPVDEDHEMGRYIELANDFMAKDGNQSEFRFVLSEIMDLDQSSSGCFEMNCEIEVYDFLDGLIYWDNIDNGSETYHWRDDAVNIYLTHRVDPASIGGGRWAGYEYWSDSMGAYVVNHYGFVIYTNYPRGPLGDPNASLNDNSILHEMMHVLLKAYDKSSCDPVDHYNNSIPFTEDDENLMCNKDTSVLGWFPWKLNAEQRDQLSNNIYLYEPKLYTGDLVYVGTLNAPSEFPDGSWEEPYDSIQDALDSGASGKTIVAETGIYKLQDNIISGEDIRIQSRGDAVIIRPFCVHGDTIHEPCHLPLVGPGKDYICIHGVWTDDGGYCSSPN